MWTKNDNNVICSQAEGVERKEHTGLTGEEKKDIKSRREERRSGEGHFISCLSPMLTFIHSLFFPPSISILKRSKSRR